MNGVQKTKAFLLALVIIIGLIFFNFPKVTSKTKDIFFSIADPLLKNINYPIKQVISSINFLHSLRDISKENLKLNEEIRELTAKNAELLEVEKENEFLRSYFNLSNRQKYQIDLANVIGQDFQGLEKYIVIDRGKFSKITENMPIVVNNNILVGKIIEVFDNYSKVLLITSPNSKIPCLIQGSRIAGIAGGNGENVLSLDLIPKDAKIESNQTVITSGIGESFPRGLLIGKISNVESKDNEMFLKIDIVPAADLEKLEQVLIIKSK